MKKEIKLTQKQEQVLNSLNKMLEKNKYQTIVVADIHCSMTAVEKIVSASWFDRTFKALEEKGLVKKEAMTVEISGGYRKGEVYDSYGYNLTDLGLEYLGITLEESTKIVTPKEEQKVLEAIAQVGNGRPVDIEGIVEFSGYTENRVKQIISDLIKKGLIEEGLFNDLFIEKDFYLSKLGVKYLTGDLDINESLNKEDILEAILEVENDKAYEQNDEVTLQVDDVYYNLKFYDTLKGNKAETMPLLINSLRFLAQDGFIEILENTKDDITFKATIEGYLYYKEARPEESIQTQILKVVNLATELFLGIKVDDNNQLHLWDYEKQKIVDDYDLPILYMTSREFDRQQDNKLEELKKRLHHVNTLLYNKVVQ